MTPIESVEGVAEVHLVRGSGADPGSPPELLIEVPHGATRREDFERLRRRLSGSYPDDLEAFFYVNTDVGAFETAMRAARWVAEPGERADLKQAARSEAALDDRPRTVCVVRGVVPRTFIDCNRVIGGTERARVQDGITPGLPEYVTDSADVGLLKKLYGSYQELVAGAYESVCGSGGRALILHTYAPRSIRIERIDADIVRLLREAYRPEVYRQWPRRPDVDLITEAGNGDAMAPPGVVSALREAYGRVGIEVAENATYRLQPSTMGFVHSARHPDHVVCIELNRERLAEPFSPFEEMRVGETKVSGMAAPIAAAMLETV